MPAEVVFDEIYEIYEIYERSQSMDIVLIARDRPELTGQTIRSAQKNAADWSRHRLVVVFDGTFDEFFEFTALVIRSQVTPEATVTGKQLGVGGAKNFGAQWFARQTHRWAPNDPRLLCFLDNDMYLLPRWDEVFERTMTWAAIEPITQLGGWRHPFHALGDPLSAVEDSSRDEYEIRKVDAVTGNCFVVRWADWLKYGPFDAVAVGPGQSEDYALSQKIRAGGGLVATLDPPVAIHCGLVNSIGEPAVGWRECETQITEQLAALPPEIRDDIIIARPTVSKPRHIEIAEAHEKAAGIRPCPPELETTRFVRRNPPLRASAVRLNCGSGQRRFDPDYGWVNIDAQSVPPDRIADFVCNVGVEPLPYSDESIEMVVLSQIIEHMGCGESAPMIRECWRVLARRGSIIITVPDLQRLAARWLGGELDEQVAMTSFYGAYMGDEADRHKWGASAEGWHRFLDSLNLVRAEALHDDVGVEWMALIKPFDWRPIDGADIARDWWICGWEIVKP